MVNEIAGNAKGLFFHKPDLPNKAKGTKVRNCFSCVTINVTH